MENGPLHDDKLFRAVHDRLSDYEAPANGADWDAMSRSLDNLPKSSSFSFRWKISLNSILVLLGIVGLSAIAFAVVNHSGNSSANNSKEQISATPPTANQNPNVRVNTSAPTAESKTATADQNTFVSNNSLGFSAIAVSSNEKTNVVPSTNAAPETNALTNADGSVKNKRKNKNQLLFGDQIDPKKGFIYNTQESQNLVTQPVVDPAPNVFYDSDNGQIRKIEIKRDSTSKKSSKSKSDSTAKATKDGAPTEGEPTGFDMEH